MQPSTVTISDVHPTIPIAASGYLSIDSVPYYRLKDRSASRPYVLSALFSGPLLSAQHRSTSHGSYGRSCLRPVETSYTVHMDCHGWICRDEARFFGNVSLYNGVEGTVVDALLNTPLCLLTPLVTEVRYNSFFRVGQQGKVPYPLAATILSCMSPPSLFPGRFMPLRTFPARPHHDRANICASIRVRDLRRVFVGGRSDTCAVPSGSNPCT